MTAYELYDLILSQQAGIATVLGLYVSLLSAYLIVAFLAGERLTRSQTTMISIMFATIVSILVLQITGRAREISRMGAELESMAEASPATFPAFVPYVAFTVLILGVLASLKFMWDIRHPKQT